MISLFSVSIVFKTFKVYNQRFMYHKVFVYGTLKRNEPNHHWLTDKVNGESRFIGEGTTTTEYPLIIATIYNIPFLLHNPGTGYFVKGEVYEVDELMLSKLDELEGHPDYYTREYDDIKVMDEATNKEEVVQCWVYFLKKFKPDLLQYTMLENYTSSGDHGKPYTERSKRKSDDHFNFNDFKSE